MTSAAEGRARPLSWIDFAVIAAIVAAGAAFKLAFAEPGPGALTMSPAIAETMARIWPGEWWHVLGPYQYEPGRNYWATTVIPFTYWAETAIGGFSSLLLFSSLFVVVSYFAARLVGASLLFASTLAFMFAFGTQLHYVYTYGNLIALFLVLTYVSVNFALAMHIASADKRSLVARILYVVSLAIVALSSEMWINYATAMIAACGLGWLWARRHGLAKERGASAFLGIATVGVLAAYLAVRMQLVGQYLAPGAEEELLVTYRHGVLFVEDAITNYFTLLYTTLSNYLPAFFTSSNSLTYLGETAIVAEQHGYDAAQQHLTAMNHLFLWRFYAGVAITVFLGFAIRWLVDAWRDPSRRAIVLTLLALMVLAGFSTHLMIKMRPYNTVPALPYKAIISITAWSVLIAYLVQIAWRSIGAAWLRNLVIGGVWASVLLAAFTRPLMQQRLLEMVGLAAYGDPLGRLLQWLQ